MSNPKLQLDLVVDDRGNIVLKNFGKQVEKTMDQAARSTSSLTTSFLGMDKVLSGLAGVAGISMLAKSFFDVGVQADSMVRSLSAALGSAEEAAKAEEFLRRESDRLGLVLRDQTSNFMQFAAAAKGTALEGHQVREVFLAVAEASTVMGLSADDASGVMRALTQMMSKGKVQTEELRGQLGERLPGAFQVAAKAMGVTTAELDKMLEQGQVVAEDFLPKFAAAMREQYAGSVGDASASLQANINRLKNTWFDFQKTVMESGVADALVDGIRAMNDGFQNFWVDNEDNLRSMVGLLGELASALLKVASAGGAIMRTWDKISLDPLEIGGFFGDVSGYFHNDEFEIVQKKIQTVSNKLNQTTGYANNKNRAILEEHLGELRNIAAGLSVDEIDGAQDYFGVNATSEDIKAWNRQYDSIQALRQRELKDQVLDNSLYESFDVSDEMAAIEKRAEDQRDRAAAKKREMEKELKEAADRAWEADGQRRLAEFRQTQGLYDAEFEVIEARQDLEIEAEDEKDARLKEQRERQAAEERDHQRLLVEEQKQALEEAQRYYEHFLNNVHDATAEVFYDVFTGGLTTFEQFADRMKDYFMQVLAEMSAKAVLKPVIVPVVTSMASTLGLGSLTGDAGAGNLFSSALDSVKTIASGASGLLGLGSASSTVAGWLGSTTAAESAAITAAEAAAAMETTVGSAGWLSTLGAGASSALSVIGPIAAVAGLGYLAYDMMQGEPTEYYSTSTGTGGYSEYSGLTLGNISTGNGEYDQYLQEKLGRARDEINANINSMLGAMDETARAQMVEYLETMSVQYGGSGADWTASDNGTGWTEIGNIRERIQRNMWTAYTQAIGQAGTLSDLGIMDGMENVLSGAPLWDQYETLKDVNLGSTGYNAQFSAFFEDMAAFREVWDQVSPILGESVSQAQSLVGVLESVSDEFEKYKQALEDVGANVSALAELERARVDKVSEIIEAAAATYIGAWSDFINDVTFSDLAPVQSAESYNVRYHDLLEQAQGGDYQSYQDLFSFLKEEYLPFAQDFGGDYQKTWDRLFGQEGEVSALKVDLGSIGTDISAGILEALGPYLEAMDGDLHLTIKIGDQAMGQVIASQIRSNSDVVAAINEVT